MKLEVFLMHPDRDFDTDQPLPANASALTEDLALSTLWAAMAEGDATVGAVVQRAMLCGVMDLKLILYRQDILGDARKHPSVVRELYAVAASAIEDEKKTYLGLYSNYSRAILIRSIRVLERFVGLLGRLRQIAEQHGGQFAAQGFARLFAMLNAELNQEYLVHIQSQLRELQFPDGVWITARLGQGLQGTQYLLHRQPEWWRPRWARRLGGQPTAVYEFAVVERDETGARALSELKDRATAKVAATLAQAADHMLVFFTRLRTELAFYVGCLNLQDRLQVKGEPLCFPQPWSSDQRRQNFQALYDICLALTVTERVVGNTADLGGKDLVMITGANQGGKSTFLRSIGLAQLMMQCGMFVPAESFRASVVNGVFTHFRREEDAALERGRLDEELKRMSEIVDQVRPGSLLLLNESFSATNEREGSEIADQIVSALLEHRINVFFVTHLYTLAQKFLRRHLENVAFLRAERQPDGARTFKIITAMPLPTSYGQDIYDHVFGDGAPGAASVPSPPRTPSAKPGGDS